MEGGGYRHEVATIVLSISSLLITFHHSLLVIGFFTQRMEKEYEERRWGEGGVVGSHSNITRSEGDPYMTSD